MNLRHTQTVTTHRSLYGRAFRVSVAVTLLTAVAAAQTAFSQSSNDAMSLLLDQNRQLQAEIQALRGQLDEQGFEIKKLQRDSLNRYTDVDQRLSDLEVAAPQTAPPATAQRAQGGTPAVNQAPSQPLRLRQTPLHALHCSRPCSVSSSSIRWLMIQLLTATSSALSPNSISTLGSIPRVDS